MEFFPNEVKREQESDRPLNEPPSETHCGYSSQHKIHKPINYLIIFLPISIMIYLTMFHNMFMYNDC
jgi:hypothetical protein